MRDTIKELYEYSRLTWGAQSEECKALEEQNCVLWEKVRPLLGMQTIDELMDGCANLSWQMNYEWFREGFRLGVALMLEAGSLPA